MLVKVWNSTRNEYFLLRLISLKECNFVFFWLWVNTSYTEALSDFKRHCFSLFANGILRVFFKLVQARTHVHTVYCMHFFFISTFFQNELKKKGPCLQTSRFSIGNYLVESFMTTYQRDCNFHHWCSKGSQDSTQNSTPPTWRQGQHAWWT